MCVRVHTWVATGLLLVWAMHGAAISILLQYIDLTLDPVSGEQTQTYLFFLRATQADNAATFIAYNVTWTNSSTTGQVIIKIRAAPPSVVYRVSPPVLMTPFQTQITSGRVCTAVASSVGFYQNQGPVPPGTPLAGPYMASKRRTRLLLYEAERDRLAQRGGIDERLYRSPTDVHHGPARMGQVHPLILPVLIVLGPALIVSVAAAVVAYFNPACWIGDCDQDDGFSAVALALDDMAQSLSDFSNTVTTLFENQNNLNDEVGNALKNVGSVNTDVLAGLAAQQTQLDVLHSQLDMLKQAFEVISQRQVELGITLSRALLALQPEVNAIANLMLQVTDVTQAQLTQQTGWIRTLVRVQRQTQANLANIVIQSSYKADVIGTFFTIFNLTNSSLIQPYLTSSEFQGPQPELLNLYTTIDTLRVQYTYQEDTLSPVLAVQSEWAYRCKNAFVLYQPRFGVSYIDLLEYFGPERCVGSIGTNNTCQCYWTVSTLTAPVADNGMGAYRPFPYGFAPNRHLDCRPFENTRPACAPGSSITSMTDPLNQDPHSTASLVFSVGSYSTMETNSSFNGMADTVQNPATSMFDVLRKLCYQQVQGKVRPLLGQGPDWSVIPCDASNPNDFQPCYNAITPNNPTFVFGPDQANQDAPRYNDPQFNFTTRIISTLLNSYWDMPSVVNVDDCPLGTSSMGMELSFQTKKLYLYTVFFYALQFGYNTFVDVIYPSLETNVTGIMPPDVQWTSQLFSPDGTVNGVSCDQYTYVQASPPFGWEPVRTLEQVRTDVEVTVTYFAADHVTQLGTPVSFTDAAPLIAFPLPPVIRQPGPLTFNAEGAYTYDVSARAISTDNSAVSREDTVTYLALPVAGWADALVRNIPLQAIWEVYNGRLIFNPIAGGNTLNTFLQFVTLWQPGFPTQCRQKFRLSGGWCSILDNYEFIMNNETAIFARFVPYTQWLIDMQLTLPSNTIAREAQSQCLTNIPNSFNLTAPNSPQSQSGIFFAFNPTAVDNSLLYTITSSTGCGDAFNIPFTIPAFSTNRIVFPNCGAGTVFHLSFFQRTGTFATPCPGAFVFTQGASMVLVPGALPPNVQANEFKVRDTVTQGFIEGNILINTVAVEMATLLIQGPTSELFNQLYTLFNNTIANIFATATNITGCNVVNGQGCGVDGIFDDWDAADAIFTEANQKAKNATDSAAANNKKLEQNTEAIDAYNEFGRNLTNAVAISNADLQAKITALSNEIQRYVQNAGKGKGSISTWLLVLVVIFILVLMGLFIYYFCFKKKEEDVPPEGANAAAAGTAPASSAQGVNPYPYGYPTSSNTNASSFARPPPASYGPAANYGTPVYYGTPVSQPSRAPVKVDQTRSMRPGKAKGSRRSRNE